MEIMEIEEIRDIPQLSLLAGEWSELCDRCPWSTPFQRPEWLLPWCRHFELDRPWVLALREKGRLVALLPLYVYTFPRPIGPDDDYVEERAVAFLGSPNSDYFDLVAEPGREAAAATACLEHLGAHADRWEVCNLEELRPGSPLLATPLPAGWTEQRLPQEACPALMLGEARSLRDVLPKRRVRNLGLLERQAARHGGAQIVEADTATCGEILTDLFRLHSARWHERGLPGVLAGEAHEGFHHEVAAGFAARGGLALFALVLAGQTVAVSYGFYEKREALNYLSGFDPRWAGCKPGVLLKGAVIAAALRRGCVRFDFLRGQEPHKYLWGAEDRWNTLRRLHHGEDR
jgi:CelD/BcsL family acetyltransferase involved in cellulose biosynthesis